MTGLSATNANNSAASSGQGISAGDGSTTITIDQKSSITVHETSLEPSGHLYLITRVWQETPNGLKLRDHKTEVIATYYRTVTRPKTVERVTKALFTLREAGEEGSILLLSRRGRPLVSLRAITNKEETEAEKERQRLVVASKRLHAEKLVAELEKLNAQRVVVKNREQLKLLLEVAPRLGLDKIYAPKRLIASLPEALKQKSEVLAEIPTGTKVKIEKSVPLKDRLDMVTAKKTNTDVITKDAWQEAKLSPNGQRNKLQIADKVTGPITMPKLPKWEPSEYNPYALSELKSPKSIRHSEPVISATAVEEIAKSSPDLLLEESTDYDSPIKVNKNIGLSEYMMLKRIEASVESEKAENAKECNARPTFVRLDGALAHVFRELPEILPFLHDNSAALKAKIEAKEDRKLKTEILENERLMTNEGTRFRAKIATKAETKASVEPRELSEEARNLKARLINLAQKLRPSKAEGKVTAA